MTKSLLALLLLSLGLTACFWGPGGGYAYEERGHEHHEHHSDRGNESGWSR